MDTKKISKKVNELVEKNNDSFKGFKKAAEKAEDHRLTTFLSQRSLKRQQYAQELSKEVKLFNPDAKVDEDGSIAGSLHRTWIDIKSALSGDSDEAILEECIRGEKAARDEYQEVMNENPTLPQSLKTTMTNQLSEINDTLNRVKRLEDLS